MTISDIENMSFADIKAKRAEAIEAAKASPDVAARYVQARADATMRDEKLAEQGVTIKALQDAIGAQQVETARQSERADKNASRADANAAAVAAGDRKFADYQQTVEADFGNAKKREQELTAKLTAETARADVADAQAKTRKAKLASVLDKAGQALHDIQAVVAAALAE